jgi:flavin-dependent dehydrogenase
MKSIDVAIIGGSLAGATCARELTRRGVDAIAFEREQFPREKVCGGFLSPGAVVLLEEIGLLNSLREAGATTVNSARVRMGGREIQFALPRRGVGVSRKTLDAVVANHPAVHHAAVREVRRIGGTFRIRVDESEMSARMVIDAAGKLSRFTSRRVSQQFGVQFYEKDSRGDVLDFWFGDQAYGGAVSVEGGRSNVCFLVEKEALRHLGYCPSWTGGVPEGRGGGSRTALLSTTPALQHCHVTGPVAYEKAHTDFIAIGDAGGMVDPFCGEGIRHALDTGIRAAGIVADGFIRGDNYDTVRARYETDEERRWKHRRRFGRLLRELIRYPRATSACFRINPEFWLRRLWN